MKSKIGQTAEFEFGGPASTLRDLRAVVAATAEFPDSHLVLTMAPSLLGRVKASIAALIVEPAAVDDGADGPPMDD